MPRWVHPDVIARAAPISLGMVLAILVIDTLGSLTFHAGGGAAMHGLERATGGLIHHSLAFGALNAVVLAVLVFGVARVRPRHLGLDRRELRRWVATAAIAWCALQLGMLGAAAVGLVPPLVLDGTVTQQVGMLAALFLHTGLVEETLLRGLLLPVLARRFGVAKGLALQALAFAAGHIPARLADTSGALELVASLSQHWFWGMVNGVMYLRSGSLLTVAAVHTISDAPTPFLINDEIFSALFVLLHAGGLLYIWGRRWP